MCARVVCVCVCVWLCFVIYYYSVTLFVSKNSYILLNFRIIRSYIRRKKKERTLFARTEFKYSRQEFNRDHQKEKRKGISLSLSLSLPPPRMMMMMMMMMVVVVVVVVMSRARARSGKRTSGTAMFIMCRYVGESFHTEKPNP